MNKKEIKAYKEVISQKIEIPFTFEDLEDLKNGKVFNWEFDGVKVKLYNEEF